MNCQAFIEAKALRSCSPTVKRTVLSSGDVIGWKQTKQVLETLLGTFVNWGAFSRFWAQNCKG